MDKSIETPFFKAFESGEVVCNCIDYIREKYDLGYMPRGENETKLDDKRQNYYNVALPKLILEETEAFEDSVIIYPESSLMDEIERNLNECQTDQQKERYLFSLLKPFSEIGSVYCPTGNINQLKKEIQKYENIKKNWEALPADKIPFDADGNQLGTPKEQIEACDSLIDRYKNGIDRLSYINSRFCEITGQQENEKRSVEHCLEQFIHIKVLFQNKLDALLLTYGIDLMRLQEESGMYLKEYRLITDVDFYIGSRELSQKYIDELPRLESRNQPKQPDFSTSIEANKHKFSTEIATDFAPYIIDCSYNDIVYVIEKKNLPNNKKKILWCGSKADAIRFTEHFGIAKAQFNKIFHFSDNEKLHSKHKDKIGTTSDINEVLGKYK